MSFFFFLLFLQILLWKKKKSLSVWIDRSLAFISGACYEHSTGDMEIGHAVPLSLKKWCVWSLSGRRMWKGRTRLLKVKDSENYFFFYWSEKSVLSVCETDFSKGRHSQLLTFFDKNNTRESYDLKATFYQKITEVAGQKCRVTKAS